ncbi:MAG: 2-oxoacid:acceptor oxidoreductase subunit alpha [Methanopyri archaeon]|nr:2-oxoacid:acceptor oxidoreductase subunit alpha [Methanopyri archaeon]
MTKDVFTFLVGGKAGEGTKKAGLTAGRLFTGRGLHVFLMDDYMSLIKGGHNFSVISTTSRPISSHYMAADLVVALDQRSYDNHRGHLTKDGVMVYNADTVKDADGIGLPLTSMARTYPNPSLRLGVGTIAVLAATVGMIGNELEALVKAEYPRDVENNIAYARAVHDAVPPELHGRFTLPEGDEARAFLTGNEAIALGAVAGGLDLYVAYPMTPASSILHYLAAHEGELGIKTMHAESELAVINLAVGAASVGARTMVGTSGGGFALMEEGLSLAGMAEVPILTVFSQRPGPATGVPTYTLQGDLFFALHYGHGEFPRIVASPATVGEAFSLTAELLDLSWRFQTPAVLLTEKHLSESRMTTELALDAAPEAAGIMHAEGEYARYRLTEDGISPLLFPPTTELVKWSSYEHDERGITTEAPNAIMSMQEKRVRKNKALVAHMQRMRTVNVYGDKGPIILTYGSTTMSVLEALRAGGLEAIVVQPLYLEPFPWWEVKRFTDERIVVVEQSATGQFARLVSERGGLVPRAVVTLFDGRPFDPHELADELRRCL